MHTENQNKLDDVGIGLISGILAYTFWGFFPIYFKLTQDANPVEILSHRIAWSVPFALIIIAIRKQWNELSTAFKSPKLLATLFFSAIALSINWGVFIYAVQNDQIFQASLGYFINPLMYILIGVLFFKEKLTKFQNFSVLLAFIGVFILTLYGGVFPYISIVLAVSFSIYGVIRKQADIGSIPGLIIETAILFIPAILFLVWLGSSSGLTFGNTPKMSFLLILAGPLTVLPLWAFTLAAKKLKLSTLGMLQYIGPTGQFILAVYYGESFTSAYAICFSLIWIGIILYSYDSYLNYSKK
jgi:chloramphenicol-sensitive protein RarD